MNRRSLFRSLLALPAAVKLAPAVKAAPAKPPAPPDPLNSSCVGYTGYTTFTESIYWHGKPPYCLVDLSKTPPWEKR